MSKLVWIQALTKLPGKLMVVVIALAVIVVAALIYWFSSKVSETEMKVTVNQGIDLTPEQIQSIKNIGEWEFLSVSDEEMVDTLRKGFFSDDHLSRIYYGTLRLGIDMQQVKEGWIKTQGDSAFVSLPAITLLSDDFIDEAKTRSFYESGRWKAEDREAMLRVAASKMKAHSLTPSNMKSAQRNAVVQMRQLFKSLGFNYIEVKFEK